MPLPASVARLLWDVEPAALDLARPAHRDLVLERVMSRGSLEAMTWLRATFSREVLAAFVTGPRGRALAPRDLAYWALVSGVETAPAEASSPGGGRPPWAGP